MRLVWPSLNKDVPDHVAEADGDDALSVRVLVRLVSKVLQVIVPLFASDSHGGVGAAEC